MRSITFIIYGCFGLTLGAVKLSADEGIQARRVFGSEHPGPYKHPASITQLDNGDLYLAYYGGEGEYARDTAVYGARLKSVDGQWSAPKVIADTPDRSEGNPVVWQAPDGLVWLFYVNRYGDTWSTSRVKVKISRDGARSWSDSFMLTFEQGTMVRGQPIVLHDSQKHCCRREYLCLSLRHSDQRRKDSLHLHNQFTHRHHACRLR